MKNLITSLVLLVVFAVSVAGIQVPAASIQPIQRVNDDGVNVNVCTAFSINKAKGLWISANHCYDETDTFAGAPIKVVAYHEPLDLMVFEGPKVTAIKLATKAPEVGDEVYLAGYPHGSLDVLSFFGRVAGLRTRMFFAQPEYRAQVIDIVALGGDSGSPLMTLDGKVIGVIQQSTRTGTAWGISWVELVANAKQFWEK